MDQSVIMSGSKNALTCIDCASHQISNIEQRETRQPWEILVVYSGLTRQLTGTPFNQRVAECHEAARALLSLMGAQVPERPLLGHIAPDHFFELESKLPDILQRRARHFFTEAARVKRGQELWARGEITEFGSLITASGESSIVNFESGSPALVALYEILAATPGVYGTRFCGGGFQGCCLALIDPARRLEIAESLHSAYTKRYPELRGEYSIHFCQSSDSVSLEVV
jgi:galactokinase